MLTSTMRVLAAVAVIVAMAACEQKRSSSATGSGSSNITAAVASTSDAAIDAGVAAAMDAAAIDTAASDAAVVDATIDPEELKMKVAGEPVGPLRQWMTEAELESALGAPKKKGKVEYAGEATADYIATWVWDGESVMLRGDTKTGPFTVATIELMKTSTLKTARGIGVGSTREQVEKAYADVKSEDSTPDNFVAGSIYGGIQFAIKRGKVTHVFIGASNF